MKIDKNSWHYRFINTFAFGWIGYRDNICKYMRGFIGACANICIGTLVLSGLIYLASMPIVHWGSGLSGGPVTILVMLGGVVDIILFLILCGFLHESRDTLYQSPFGRYIKDKHDNICTMIEYE